MTARTVAPMAAVDMGSNSFHLLVADWHDGRLRPLAAASDKALLALGVDNGRLSQSSVERACRCLQRFAAIAARCGATFSVAAGTSVFREAINAAELADRAGAILGGEVAVVSGRTEARLIYRGVCTVEGAGGHRLVVDVGAGSTELISGRRGAIANLASVDVGCVRVLKRFFADRRLDAAALARAREHSAQLFADAFDVPPVIDEVVGCSGTLQALSTVAGQSGATGVLTLARLEAVRHDLLARFDCIDAVCCPRLSANRALLLAPGLAIALGLFDALAIDALRLTPAALREGLAAEYLQPGYAYRRDSRRDYTGPATAAS